MKKISWLILVIFVCSGINGLLFAQESISIRGCYCPRWSPTNEEIGFVGRFSKIVRTKEEVKDLVGYGIAAINQNDLSIRYITPIAWEKNEPSTSSGYDRSLYRKKENEIDQNIGDYNTNTPTKKQTIIPFLSQFTIFDWSTDGAGIFFYDAPECYYSRENNMYMWAIQSDGINLRPVLKINEGNLPGYLQCLNSGKIAIIPRLESNTFYILNSDGKKQSQIIIPEVSTLGENGNFGLSKDGKKIAIIYDRNIYIKGTSGSKVAVNLTKAEKIGKCSWPSWSPDGKKIVFIFIIRFSKSINLLRDQASVWVIDADGKNCRPLTAMVWDYEEDPTETKSPPKAPDDICPSWSPDGKKIVFLRSRHSKKSYEIWTINSDGSNQAQLTNGQAVAGEIAKK